MDNNELLTPEVLVPRLGDQLVQMGLLTDAQLKQALDYQRAQAEHGNPRLLGQALIDLHLLDRPTLDRAITEQILRLRSALEDANKNLENRVRQRTAELEGALRKLSELSQMKANFVANVSHELRTPLTHIRGYLELLSTEALGPLNEDQIKALDVSVRSTGRLQTLIDDLIQFSLAARGEDVVAGIRNADPVERMVDTMPEVYNQFMDITAKLEKHYKEMQDVEFTIERGRLWMLQTRNGKRTAKAAVKIAVDMALEGLISKDEAVLRVTPENVDALLHPQFDDKAKKEAEKAGKFLAKGVNASPGAAVGQAYFDADTAEKMAKEEKQDTIMVRPFTKPDDVHGMIASKGVLTSEGGATSHAAVVARQFGIPCVVGASELKIDMEKRQLAVGDTIVKEGDWISVDGTTGQVFVGKIPTIAPTLEEQTELMTLLTWADEISSRESIRLLPDGRKSRGLQVWANADYPKDARRARSYGAVGIGLCRTEHMFFEPERLPIVQKMILADSSEERTKQLNLLLPSQRSDFDGLFDAMNGYPVIIRLIDPPLHEFMPDEEKLLEEVIEMRVKGEKNGLAEKESLLAAIKGLHESNPMMGLRGVRLSIAMPEIVEMQVRAIFEAAADCTKRGVVVHPEVMIPLTGTVKELEWIQPRLERIASAVMGEKGVQFSYKFGTMIEIPRAAVTAAEIAKLAQFFSFGTNDLTQMTFGYSRDDAERNFLVTYVEQGILPVNPFQQLDRDGVGKLMQMAVNDGRKTRPELEVGICGEHGGDPSSIEWCHMIGNNYVSCSPFRVPIARLAAAHSALKHSGMSKAEDK